MLVLSVGIPKSGSGWYFNLKNDLLIAAGHQDVRDIRKKFNLESCMKYYNCNMSTCVYHSPRFHCDGSKTAEKELWLLRS